jgi:Ca2+/Na+ antiporter
MELDSLKDIWKNLDEEDLRPAQDVPIMGLLHKRSQGSIAKLKRNLKRELVAIIILYTLMIGYYITAWHGRYWELSVLLFIIGAAFVFYYYRKNKLLKEMQCVTCEVKSNLKHQLVTLEKYVRFYFVAGTLLTPLAYLAAGAIIFFKTPANVEPGFPDASQLIDAQLPVVTHIAKHRFFLMYAILGMVLTVGIYFLNRWYVNKLYGQHIQKLKELLLQMEEADES